MLMRATVKNLVWRIRLCHHVSGNPGRGRAGRTCIDLIGEVLQKDQVRSTHNLRARLIRNMNVDEARRVYKDQGECGGRFCLPP